MRLTATKAIWGAVVGFLAPGAALLIAGSADGFTGDELVVAGLTCIVSAAAVAGTVYRVENKPKAQA